MKFQIGKKELLESLKSVLPAVANRSSLPILGGIRLEATDGRMKLEATDLELAIRLETPAETSNGHGRAVVPGKNFLKAVKAMADSTVVIEIKRRERPQDRPRFLREAEDHHRELFGR